MSLNVIQYMDEKETFCHFVSWMRKERKGKWKMEKKFKEYVALGLAVLLIVCAFYAQAESVGFKPGDRSGQDDGVFRYRENGAEEKVDVTMIEEGQSPGRFTYLVTSHDTNIKYCVPSARMGIISVVQSPEAEMKLVTSVGKQECRIYFCGNFKLAYEPFFGAKAKGFGDEMQLDFYLDNGQWICKKTVALGIGLNIPPDNHDIDGGWRELGLASH